MKRTNPWIGAFFLTILALLLLFTLTSCPNPTGSPDPDDNEDDTTDITDELALSDLAGIWYKDFGSTPYQLDPDTDTLSAEEMILKIEASNFQVLFFNQTEQIYGVQGTFTISEESLILTNSSEWDSAEFWQSITGTDTMPISLADNTLDITPPEQDIPITLTKTAFTSPTSLVGSWKTADDNEALVFNSDGTYAYTGTDFGSETGRDWAITGTTSGRLMNTTLARDDGEGFRDVNICYLTPYEISDGKLLLTYPQVGQVTFIPDTTTTTDFSGSWICDFGETLYTLDDMETPDPADDVIADAAVFEVNESSYEFIFYKDTEQVFGSRGTLNPMGIKIIISFTETWDATNFWQADSGSEWVDYDLSETELTLDGPGGELTLNQTSFSQPTDLHGVWASQSTPVQIVAAGEDGNYEFYADDLLYEPETGIWDASATHFRSVTTQRWNEEQSEFLPVDISYLTPYTLTSATLTMEYPGESVSFDLSESAATLEDTDGTWLQDFGFGSGVIPYREEEFAEAILIEISDGEFDRILYTGTEQVFGNRGTLRILGEYLLITGTEDWNNTDYWYSEKYIDILRFSISGSTLTIHDIAGDMTLTNTPFTQPPSWLGTWDSEDDSMQFVVSDDGSYSFTSTSEDMDDESGQPWGVSGSTSGYFRNLTLSRDVGGLGFVDVEISYLTPYALNGDDIILSYPDGQEGTVDMSFIKAQ